MRQDCYSNAGSSHNSDKTCDSIVEKVSTSLCTKSEATFDLARLWIRNCQQGHALCSSAITETSFLPSRLVDVGLEGSVSLKLHICNPETDKIQYLTLSHCWGDKPLYSLIQENLDSLQEFIPLEELPQNFQDAISTCRRLSKRYIWIDSLCIIQDSPRDWEEQSAVMDLIYANSWCTIAALCAEDSTQGFFRVRNPRLVQSCRLPMKEPHSKVLEARISSFHFGVARPLYSRAWVFQERFLSPRVLQFGENQLSWECREMVAAEVDPDGSSPRSDCQQRLADDQLEYDHEIRDAIRRLVTIDCLDNASLHNDFLRSWKVILRTYTSMKLTYASDRLAGILGFIKAQKRYNGLSYFEGLWVECLLPMLLWHAPYPGHGMAAEIEPQGTNLRCSFTSLANSLSWASLEGKMDYPYIWPCCKDGVSQVASLNSCYEPGGGSCVRFERTHTWKIGNCVSGLRSRTYAGRSPDDPSDFPPQYRYCTSLKAITPHNSLSKWPSIVRLEGPILRFRSVKSWRNSLPLASPWSHPLTAHTFGLRKWFYPDLEELGRCPEGAELDIACLVIIEWVLVRLVLREGARAYYGPRDNVRIKARAAGVVLIECLEQDVKEQTRGEKTYCRVGFFEFQFSSSDFGPLRELTTLESVAII